MCTVDWNLNDWKPDRDFRRLSRSGYVDRERAMSVAARVAYSYMEEYGGFC